MVQWKDLQRVEFYFDEIKLVIDRKTREVRPVFIGTSGHSNCSGQMKELLKARVNDLFDMPGGV